MRIMFNHHGIIETVANIETCDSICVLGFTLSCNLSFKAHVETMIKRAYSAIIPNLPPSILRMFQGLAVSLPIAGSYLSYIRTIRVGRGDQNYIEFRGPRAT